MAKIGSAKDGQGLPTGGSPLSAADNLRRRTVALKQWQAYRPRRSATPVQVTFGEIGKTIRLLRLAAGWSQVALAQRAGLPQATISGLEAGRSLTLPNLSAIAASFGMSGGDLLKATERRRRATGPQKALLAVADELAEGFDQARIDALLMHQS